MSSFYLLILLFYSFGNELLEQKWKQVFHKMGREIVGTEKNCVFLVVFVESHVWRIAFQSTLIPMLELQIEIVCFSVKRLFSISYIENLLSHVQTKRKTANMCEFILFGMRHWRLIALSLIIQTFLYESIHMYMNEYAALLIMLLLYYLFGVGCDDIIKSM